MNDQVREDLVVVGIENLKKSFGENCALDNVSIKVLQGHVFGLVGENGAGKTTLINHILGALTPDQGKVSVFGLDPVKFPKEVLSRIGYLSETRDMPRWMRIEQFLRYMSAFYPSWNMEYAYKLLEQFDLDPERKIGRLSRGELARTGLLVAIAHRPDLLLLDEPSSGLDPVARMDILSAIVRSVAEEGRTVLFSSHLLDEVERVADYVCMLHQGRVILSAKLDEIRDRFHLFEVQKFNGGIDFEGIKGVMRVYKLGHGYQVLYEGKEEEGKAQIQVKGGVIVNIQTPSLEEIFVAYVKSHKRS
ncbi:MAG: ABC transporter ATP-binding protein [Candidatus Hydrogenedentes bacterium]|nr:ABC transporter ATP-binding protein [Candidatus Hydrogenedentota bacterium]